MDAVTITVQNLSTVLTDDEAKAITSALNTQAVAHYNPSCWVTEDNAAPVAQVEFIAKGETIPPDTWHIELLDKSDQEGALGYHEDEAFDNKVDGQEADFAGPTKKPRKASAHSSRGLRADAPEVPLAKVFCETIKQDGEQSSEVASHEMLEMLVDPQVVKSLRTVTDRTTQRIYPVEVCDPVQSTPDYTIDVNGVNLLVSNFVTPAYFRLPQTANPTQYDYCNVLASPVPAMTPGGYLSFAPVSDPEGWQQEFGSAGAS